MTDDSLLSLSLGIVLSWREPPHPTMYPLPGDSPYPVTGAWEGKSIPLPQGRTMLRGHSRCWVPHSYCWRLCCNGVAIHLFLLPSSLYFTHHNCFSQEHSLINPLHTNLTVAETVSRGTWHTTHGPWNELYFSLSALSFKSGCNGSLRYTVLQVGEGNSIFLCMDWW